jgi:hypothetical protein
MHGYIIHIITIIITTLWFRQNFLWGIIISHKSFMTSTATSIHPSMYAVKVSFWFFDDFSAG